MMYNSIKIKRPSTLSPHHGKQSQASNRVPASNLGQHPGCRLCRSLRLVIEELPPFCDPFLVIFNTFLDGTIRVELASERKVKCGSGDITTSALHMVLCLIPKLSLVLEESKYETHEINDFDEPTSHL